MFRFDAKRGYYLYPEINGGDGIELFLNSGVSFEKNVQLRGDISIKKYGLKIPSAESYNTFKDSIEKREVIFKTNLIV